MYDPIRISFPLWKQFSSDVRLAHLSALESNANDNLLDDIAPELRLSDFEVRVDDWEDIQKFYESRKSKLKQKASLDPKRDAIFSEDVDEGSSATTGKNLLVSVVKDLKQMLGHVQDTIDDQNNRITGFAAEISDIWDVIEDIQDQLKQLQTQKTQQESSSSSM